MADYCMTDLSHWNEKIERLVADSALSCYEQHFEMCSYEDMLCYEAYVGMPSHYHHWSYGKAYERQKTYYQYNLTGLPYEMVINSDPCLAYLMRDNTLLLQILTMAHVYGHNDFFKNNRLFAQNTRAELTIELFKGHAVRVRDYIQHPNIGPERVERVLDAAHALRFQITRRGAVAAPDRLTLTKERGQTVPERLADDLLWFLTERGRMEDWERDLVSIVRDESLYFLPQIETKIMNEGWASYWHYQILRQLELPQGLHLEFLQRHNMVIRPHEGRINPYYVGFKLFESIDKNGGAEAIFAAREQERDQSFIRRFLTRELCEEMNLFAFRSREDDAVVITEIADDTGWKPIRDTLAQTVGLGGIPVIIPRDVEQGKLVLEHLYDGRELELDYARETLKYVVDLWGGPAELRTLIGGKQKNLLCRVDKTIIDEHT